MALACIASAAVLDVGPGKEYSDIQSAINSAGAEDIIQVCSGAYGGGIDVNKPVYLRGLDTGQGMPVIYISGSRCAVTISADGVMISGFNITSPIRQLSDGIGIAILSDDNLVLNNSISFGWNCILLSGCRNNTLSGNVLTNGDDCLSLIGSDDNLISRNQIHGNEDGIFLDHSSNNTVIYNQVNDNSDDGIICINHSTNNFIAFNNADNSGWHGLETIFSSDNNTFLNNTARGCGICCVLVRISEKNNISNNWVSDGSDTGIMVVNSASNIFANNNVSYNGKVGIDLEVSQNNLVTCNNASHNGITGIQACNSRDNTIFSNNLIDNGKYSAYDDDGTNRWHNGQIGNRYSSYDNPEDGCRDRDGDGICDSMYRSRAGNVTDPYPIASGIES